MASFYTHIGSAAAISGTAAVTLGSSGIISPTVAIGCFCAGTIGGILPDIDVDYGKILRLMFNALAALLAVSVVFAMMGQLPALQLIAIGWVVFAAIRFLLAPIFKTYTRHRGQFHSLLAAFMFCFLVASLCFHVLKMQSIDAWLVSFFVLTGYILHLILDETYDVDIMENPVYRPFGSALRIIDFSRPVSAFFFVIAFGVSLAFVPDISEFNELFGKADTYGQIWRYFLP